MISTVLERFQLMGFPTTQADQSADRISVDWGPTRINSRNLRDRRLDHIGSLATGEKHPISA
jgi:hypothetical protein